jgi:mediator of RNA polymerase II transcription subunit 17
MDKDGSIMLDPALALKPKTLRVRISENGKITGTSHLPAEGGGDSVAIESTIQLARDSLFEEELYQEMTLETRQLLAYGAEYRDSVIHVTVSEANDEHGAKKLLIDCIPREGRATASQEHTNDWLAQNIAEGLRLLLVHEHSMRLHRRTQLPPPLTGQKRDKPPTPLLRTLLAVFHHLDGVNSLYDYLESTAKTLERAGLGVQLETTREVSWAKLAQSLQNAPKKGLSETDQLLEIFSKPFDGRATLSLPSANGTQPEVLTISTRTLIGQPTFGTEHKLALSAPFATELGLFQQMKFTTVPETTSYLDWILSLHIAHRQLKSDFSDRVTVKANDARITIGNKDCKKDSVVQQDIQVELQDGELKLTATATDAAEGTHLAEQSYTWKGQEGEMSMKEKVTSWLG